MLVGNFLEKWPHGKVKSRWEDNTLRRHVKRQALVLEVLNLSVLLPHC
jgi:hypothetical protein